MNFRKLTAILLLLVFARLPLHAVGTVTQTLGRLSDTDSYVITLTVTGDATTGAVPATNLLASGPALPSTNGYSIVAVVTDPGAVAPTDNYDLTFTDTSGVDLLAAACADRDTATTERCSADPVPINGPVTMNIANNTAAGATITVYVYIVRQTVAKRGGTGSGGGTTYTAGEGIAITGTEIAVEPTLIPRYYKGSGAPAINCTEGRDIYEDTAADAFYDCTATNTWTIRSAGAGSGEVSLQKRLGLIQWVASTTVSSHGDSANVTGTASGVAADATNPGRVALTSGTASGDEAGLAGGATVWRRSQNFNGFFQIQLTDTSSIRGFWGLADQVLATMVSADNPAGNYYGFGYSTPRSDTNWKCYTKDGSTQNVQDSGVAVGTATNDFEIIENTASGNVTFKINGTSVCGSPVSANLPAANTLMRYVAAIETATTAARVIRVSRIYIRVDK